jgi:hypothetical protein
VGRRPYLKYGVCKFFSQRVFKYVKQNGKHLGGIVLLSVVELLKPAAKSGDKVVRSNGTVLVDAQKLCDDDAVLARDFTRPRVRLFLRRGASAQAAPVSARHLEATRERWHVKQRLHSAVYIARVS